MKPTCIFFDLDNTLVDRPASLRKYSEQFAKDFGDALGDISTAALNATIQEADGGGYIPKEHMFANLLTILPWKSAPDKDTIRHHWFSVYPQWTVGMRGFRDVLRDVRSRDIGTGLLTSGLTTTQETKVDLLDIRGLLDVILVSEATGYKKPAPEIFQIALDKAGTTAEETWFVGDHPDNDIVDARDVGHHGRMDDWQPRVAIRTPATSIRDRRTRPTRTAPRNPGPITLV